MELTDRQLDFLTTEIAILIRIIEAKERDKCWTGLGADKIRLQLLSIILELHELGE